MKSKPDSHHHDKRTITRFEALQSKKLQFDDLCLVGLIFIIGILAIWTGQMAGYRLSPLGAAQVSAVLDELQLPRQLPNLPVERQDGSITQLWEVASKKRNVVSVYAPWCPACQKELPMLSEALSEDGQLVVLISQKQNREDVQEQLKNLGLSDLPYYRDMTGQILLQGKVTKLPTTFLLRDFGTVLDRLVGFSEYRLSRLIKNAKYKPNIR